MSSALSILSTAAKFFRADGTEVPASSLQNKPVAIYFSASWCPPCRQFTPLLAQAYQELQSANKPLEVVFVSLDSDKAQFEEYHKKMPWLAVPMGDAVVSKLSSECSVLTIPKLVVLDEKGEVLTTDGVGAIRKLGAAGYPWANFRSSVCSQCTIS